MTNTITLSAATVILLVLAAYSLYLAMQLRRQKQQQKAIADSLNEGRATRDEDARQSIQIIARALVQKDLTETEAAMRIGFLSQKVIASEEEATLFSVFQQLAEATSHIPILDDWVMLERSEKRRLTAERESIEKNYSEFMQASAKALMTLSLTR
ncbi:DUF2489 domain-containing protein [Porticoccaceae bacterium]|nr:DUF2489 domain-containing protein [Porticoccaceae bacterium]MDB4262803.1 DUF2489 domain-containing protein [Porticoccaceae bacterium]MDB9724639.1 DUF2489 domain-containing protein [bacterium]